MVTTVVQPQTTVTLTIQANQPGAQIELDTPTIAPAAPTKNKRWTGFSATNASQNEVVKRTDAMIFENKA
jgi:hypothetical protein